MLADDYERILRTMSYAEICEELSKVTMEDVKTIREHDEYGLLGSANMDMMRDALRNRRDLQEKAVASCAPKKLAKPTHQPTHGGQFGSSNMQRGRSASAQSERSSASSGSGSYNVVPSSRSDTGSETEYRKVRDRGSSRWAK